MLQAKNIFKQADEGKNPATFTMVLIKEVKTVGEPSYTSGVQKWKGAAETLKERATINSTSPVVIIADMGPEPMFILFI